MRTYDDPLHPAAIRLAAHDRRHYRRWGVKSWSQFRKMGDAAAAPIVLLRAAEEAHDDAFLAGVAYAKAAIKKGAKP